MGDKKKKDWRSKRNLPKVDSFDMQLQNQVENSVIRGYCATDLIWEYVDHQHRINIMHVWFKCLFFAIVCVGFAAVVWVCLASIWKISQKDNIAIADVGVAVTSMVSLISAVIVLPTKIAEYLFPADGEKDITSFILNFIQKAHEIEAEPMKGFNDDEDDANFLKTMEQNIVTDVGAVVNTESGSEVEEYVVNPEPPPVAEEPDKNRETKHEEERSAANDESAHVEEAFVHE